MARHSARSAALLLVVNAAILPARLAFAASAAPRSLEPAGAIALPGVKGGFDLMAADVAGQRLYLSCGSGFLDVVRQLDADRYERIDRIATAKGAATSLFVPELDRLYLAVPAHDASPAELRIFRPASESVSH